MSTTTLAPARLARGIMLAVALTALNLLTAVTCARRCPAGLLGQFQPMINRAGPA